MLFHLLLLALFNATVAAVPSDVLSANPICGFANRGGSSPQFTYFGLNECLPLGKATPVRNVYRELSCDCTLYKDAGCQTKTWILSVDYGKLREDVGELSEYYKCTARTGRGDELKKE